MGMAVEKFDVEHAEYLVSTVGGHRRSPCMTHRPGNSLALVSVMKPGSFGVLPSPTSTRCILTRRRSREQKPRHPENPPCPVGFAIRNTPGSAKIPCLHAVHRPRPLISRGLFRQFVHFVAVLEGSQQSGDKRASPERPGTE